MNLKGDVMAVSSTTSSSSATAVQATIQKKAQDVQAQQVSKVLESASEQAQDVTAQKTGVGGNLNITG